MSLDRPPVHISSAALGPNEVGARTFATVRRGFDPDAVRRFLEEVAVLLRQASQREAELETRLVDAERRAANPEIDEATLASAVGLETARVLQAAHDAARDVVARAEAEAASLRAQAESVLDERTGAATAQAEEIILRARAEAAELREAAERAASATRDTTTEQCRAMVAEAREARRRVLADLAARRRSLHLQIEQLRAGKDTLLGVVDAVANEVELLRARLAGAEEQAREAADDVTDHLDTDGERASSEDLAGLSVLSDELVAETLLAAEQLAEQGRPGAAADGETDQEDETDVLVEELLEPDTAVESTEDASASATNTGAGAEEPGGADAHDGDAADGAAGADSAAAEVGHEIAAVADELGSGARGADVSRVASGEAGIESLPRTESGQDAAGDAQPVAAAPGVAGGETAELPLGAERGDTDGTAAAGVPAAAPAPTPADDGADADDEASAGELQAAGDTGNGSLEAGGPSGKPTVDELFARIRANRAQEVAEAHRVLGSQPSQPSPEAGTAGNPPPAAPSGASPTSDTSQPATAASATATAVAVQSPEGVKSANGPTPGTREPAGRSRRRVGTSAAVAEEAKELPAAGSGDEGGTSEPLSAAAAVIAQRDELLGGCPSELARRLKRALLEEQNEILDALRHRRKDEDAGAVVVDSLNAARLAEAAAALLGRCHAAGCGFAEALTEPGAQHLLDLDAEPGTTAVGVAALLADEISEQIVGRLTQGIDELGGDPSGIPSLVGSVYREWKGERVERVAADYANRAFSDGVGEIAARAGLLVRWVVDDSGGGCPDCDDNELAGAVGAEDEFPTGHLRPPIHAGCRCLLVPVLA